MAIAFNSSSALTAICSISAPWKRRICIPSSFSNFLCGIRRMDLITAPRRVMYVLTATSGKENQLVTIGSNAQDPKAAGSDLGLETALLTRRS